MKILFIDDEKIRFDIFKNRVAIGTELVYAQTLDEAIIHLKSHVEGIHYFDILHLDHDSYDEDKKTWLNTQGLAQAFMENCPLDKAPKMAIIHSVNVNGSWALHHIFNKTQLMQTFMVPFRVEPNEYLLAIDLITKGKENVKI